MSKLIRKVKGAHGNSIRIEEFGATIVVFDEDCQMSRRYSIGALGELSMGEEKEIIKSRAQIVRAWESGDVWF